MAPPNSGASTAPPSTLSSGERVSFTSIPSSIVTLSVLPYTNSSEWLSFRLASRGCYLFVHGGSPGDKDGADEEALHECNKLWRSALIRDFGFKGEGEGDPSEGAHRPYHLHTFLCRDRRSGGDPSFLRTDDFFVASSSFVSWKHWKKLEMRYCRETGDEGGIIAPYFLRARRIWGAIEHWCENSRSGVVGERIMESLNPGQPVTNDIFLVKYDHSPDRLPSEGRGAMKTAALQAIYSFHCGQRHVPQMPEDDEAASFLFAGLFGGYSAYNHFLSVSFLKPDRDIVFADSTPNSLPIAFPFTNPSSKVFEVNLETGQVNYRVDLRTVRPATPQSPEIDPAESVLFWFEALISRIESGELGTGHILPPESTRFDTRGLLLFPTERDTLRTSRAVTRGVEVVASSVFAPEARGGMSVYSIRIRLLTPGDDGYLSPAERGFNTCQLRSRHWIITDHDADGNSGVHHVRGDGVIGMYPVLWEGGYRNDCGRSASLLDPPGGENEGVFVYQSCTEAINGSFGGELEFVPGTLTNPKGDPFDVEVAAFPLENDPAYIF